MNQDTINLAAVDAEGSYVRALERVNAMLHLLRRRRIGAMIILSFAEWTLLSASAAPSTRPTYGQQVVAAVLMGEAWGEGEAAMIAVAEVIRVRADAAGLSPLAVVEQPFQFSCLNGIHPRELIGKFLRHRDFEVALRIARDMYNSPSELPGIAKGATHFERVGNRAHWTRGLQPVARFGRLDFYRIRS
jgi:spore germination cell wall hydrolase CwlJ-like protein